MAQYELPSQMSVQIHGLKESVEITLDGLPGETVAELVKQALSKLFTSAALAAPYTVTDGKSSSWKTLTLAQTEAAKKMFHETILPDQKNKLRKGNLRTGGRGDTNRAASKLNKVAANLWEQVNGRRPTEQELQEFMRTPDWKSLQNEQKETDGAREIARKRQEATKRGGELLVLRLGAQRLVDGGMPINEAIEKILLNPNIKDSGDFDFALRQHFGVDS